MYLLLLFFSVYTPQIAENIQQIYSPMQAMLTPSLIGSNAALSFYATDFYGMKDIIAGGMGAGKSGGALYLSFLNAGSIMKTYSLSIGFNRQYRDIVPGLSSSFEYSKLDMYRSYKIRLTLSTLWRPDDSVSFIVFLRDVLERPKTGGIMIINTVAGSTIITLESEKYFPLKLHISQSFRFTKVFEPGIFICFNPDKFGVFIRLKTMPVIGYFTEYHTVLGFTNGINLEYTGKSNYN